MSAEAWPTEAAATAAVDAAARKLWDMQRVMLPPSMGDMVYADLAPMRKNDLRRAVLDVVWAALYSLPDPRYIAWEEGRAAGPDTINPYKEA